MPTQLRDPSARPDGKLHSDKVRFVAALVAVAVGSAAFAVSFRALLAATYLHFFGAANVVDSIARLPAVLRVGVPVTGGFLAGMVSLFRAGIPQNVSNVMEAVALGNVRLSLRTTLRRVTSSWLAIASGISIGREGPLIEFGGSLGAAIGRAAQVPVRQTRVLVAAGTAAGFAAAYNTPFAAVLFVLETIVGIAALEAVIPTIVATVVSSVLTRAIVGRGPIYGARAFTTTSAWSLRRSSSLPSSVRRRRLRSNARLPSPNICSNSTRPASPFVLRLADWWWAPQRGGFRRWWVTGTNHSTNCSTADWTFGCC